MPVVASASEFLQIARKSEQIDVARLDDFLASHDDLPDSPRKLAVLLIRQGLLTPFQAEQFLLGKYKGFSIGGYRVIDRLGAGGAGTVYLAEHSMMKRKAAIKVLPTHLADDPAMLERFRGEAQAAAILDHANVVHLYDFRCEGRLYFIVMEYVDGPTLQQVLARKGGLNVHLACEYARQTALGLQHAHEHGLVHRDVKPANILVDAFGTIKVLDLGLARMERDDGGSITRQFNSGAVLGTADYLAPEQAMNLHEVDARADIYSLGATLYALLTGWPPFHEGTIGQKLLWHQTREPEPISVLRPDVPPEVADLVARMLAKHPDDRPASMNEVVAELTPWTDHAAFSAHQPSARTLVEIRLGAGAVPGSTSRLLPAQAETPTWVAASDDTSRHEKYETPAAPVRLSRQVKRPVQRWSPRTQMLVGAAAVVAGVLAGVLALWLMGP